MNDINLFSGKIALVVSSEKEQRDRFCKMLNLAGFEEEHILCAENHQEAIPFLLEKAVDIIFMELSRESTPDIPDSMTSYSVCSLINNKGEVPLILTVYVNETLGPIRPVAIRTQGVFQMPSSIERLSAISSRALTIQEMENRLPNLYPFNIKGN